MSSGQSDETKSKVPANYRIVALVGAVVVLLGLSMVLPVREYIQAFMLYLQELGPFGLVLLAVVYVFACVLFVPGSLLTLGAGFLAATLWPDNFLFALLMGTVTVSVGSVTGATAAFIIGRTVARDWIEARISGNAKFRALDEAIAQKGLKMVFLVRLSPAFPFNLLNYALGLTKVRLRDAVLGSWAGMLPGTVMYVYFGMGIQSVTAMAGDAPGGDSPGKLIFQLVGLAATIAVVAVVTRTAKRAFDDAVKAGGAAADEDTDADANA